MARLAWRFIPCQDGISFKLIHYPYLASPLASFITGEVLDMNEGLHFD